MVWFDDETFDEIRRMKELMNRAFWGNNTRHALGHRQHKGKELSQWTGFRSPVCDMYETEGSIIAAFELPGADKNDIDLNVTDDHVEVKVGKKTESKVEKKGYYRYESRSQQFYRKIQLPADVKAQDATAEFKDGILKIEIPKRKRIEEKKKKILIK